MKYLQTRKRAKASAFIGGLILLFIALSLFAGCSVYALDDSGTIADTDISDDGDASGDSGTSSSGGTSSDSTSSVSYTASELAGSYTGSSTLNAKLLEIMQNCTDPTWTEWLEKAYPDIMKLLGDDGFKTTGVTSVALTLSAGSSFTMNIIYQSTLVASTLYNQEYGELEISGTWSVSGSDLTFTYSSSNVETDWGTAPDAIVGIIRTLVNGAEMWTDGSNLYGKFGYGEYWTDSSDELFTGE